ncbi:MAG: aminotransferase class III-fold pyridoxal phosphate-dependent enzyme [Myxococcales bacterium]|nr:aminotransferase class III-fold pyridoxal phosphate-dependent enzyme [Myxococcales bacterium]MCB9539904.1 aminotransferase class III-fold pyridoxal phosphate-dependent enzyme [Myxococcales bacterium]
MNSREIIEGCKDHTMWSWAKGNDVSPLPIARAEGIYMYTPEGERIIDFNSQLMSVNIGHGHPKVRAAMKRQIDELLYVYPGAATAPRARLAKRLAAMLPGDLDTCFFTLGGAEANENAIKAARLYTGRHKILSRYRSYHGATNACMQLTGDPRRLFNEPGMPGVVRVMDPQPYDYSFGATDAERVANNLRYLEEIITYEGPQTIAAMFIETVTGTNGILPPPEGYLPALKALLEKYGILLVCDEVMCGFGRTGKMFAVEHYGVVPDIITLAKGLTSSYAPLGCMAVRAPIAKHFAENVFWGGLTYNAHCLGLATAEAVLDVMEEEKLVERAARMGEVMHGHMARLKAKHPCVRTHRNLGLFGIVKLQDRDGNRIAPYNGTHPAMAALAKHFRDNGLFTFVRWDGFMCNPPLIIDEAQMAEAFEIIDRGLTLVDQLVGG